MNTELKILKYISNRLPKIPKITGLVNRIFKTIYYRNEERKKEKIVTNIYGLQLELEPYECVDGGLFFMPHIYDNEEFNFLKSILNYGDTFLDVGANIGIYSLLASNMVGNKGKVISVEADPYNYSKLLKNIKMNDLRNIVSLNIGASDTCETLELGINDAGNRGGNSFLSDSEIKIHVKCQPLHEILQYTNIDKIKLLKIDIEGFEYRVLKKFFENINSKIIPEYIIIEYIHDGKSIDLLKRFGYITVKRNKYNEFLKYEKK